MRKGILLASVLGIVAGLVSAQVPTGGLDGHVKDESGAVVPGATVTIRNKETGATRSLVTTEDGAYSAPQLPAGGYEVRVEVKGFRSALVNLMVQTGSTTTAPIQKPFRVPNSRRGRLPSSDANAVPDFFYFCFSDT